MFTKKRMTAGFVILSAFIISAMLDDFVIKKITSRLRPFDSNPMPKSFSLLSGNTVSLFA